MNHNLNHLHSIKIPFYNASNATDIRYSLVRICWGFSVKPQNVGVSLSGTSVELTISGTENDRRQYRGIR